MVVTRSGGGSSPSRSRGRGSGRGGEEGKREVVLKHKYTRKKCLFASPQLNNHPHDDDHHSPLSAPQETLMSQLTHSGTGLLCSDLLRHHGQNTATQPHRGRITRVARRGSEAENFEKPKVEETEGSNSATKFVENTGRKSSYILKKLQGENLFGSNAQADIQFVTVQPSEAVDPKMQTGFSAEGEGTHCQGNVINLLTLENMLLRDGEMALDDINNDLEETVGNFFPKIVSSNNNNDQEERGSCGFLTNKDQSTTSLNLTEMVQQMDFDDNDAVDSPGCYSNLISIRGYKVKPEDTDVFSSILSKHGDIAANCALKSTCLRSLFMQYLCDTIKKLMKTSIALITESELEKMLFDLSDIEGACIEVGWLKKRLLEIYEAKQAIPMLRRSSMLKQAHADLKSKIQSTREKMEVYKKEIVIRQAEISIKQEELRNFEEQIFMTKEALIVDEMEAMKTEKVIGEYKAKLRHIVELGSLHHGLV